MLSPVLSRDSRHPVRRYPWPEICRRACPIKPFSFILMRLDGSKRKFQAVQRLSSDCDFDRPLRSISNLWSGCSARRPATLPIPPVCEAQFSERYREGFEEDNQASVCSVYRKLKLG